MGNREWLLSLAVQVEQAVDQDFDRALAEQAWTMLRGDGFQDRLWEMGGEIPVVLKLCPDGWAWSVGSTGPDDQPHACLTAPEEPHEDIEGSAPNEHSALLAAILRAHAHCFPAAAFAEQGDAR